MVTPGSTPLVSLVMPVWRTREEWLAEAVESALHQVGCATELIIVDDGNERPVAELVSRRGDACSVIRIAHGGTSAARNAGTQAAAGDFIRYIDSDDVIAPESTAELLEASGGRYIAHGQTLVCTEDLEPVSVIASDLDGWIAPQGLLQQFDTTIPSLLFPRWVVEAAGGFDPRLRLCQDYDFVMRCLDHAEVRSSATIATFYRRHPASTTHSPHASDDAEQTLRAVVTAYFRRHPEAKGTDLEKEAWRVILEAEALRYVSMQSHRFALRRVRSMLAISPVRAVRMAAALASPTIRQELALRLPDSVRTSLRRLSAVTRAGRS